MISSLVFLGTGASLGVPLIGCSCEVCQSKIPYNKRSRSSALVKVGDKRLLIDVGPDFRMQALQNYVHELDGVIITHAHQDHVAGLDDLRPYSFKSKKSLDCLMSQETSDELNARFFFMFQQQAHEGDHTRLRACPIQNDAGQIEFQGVPISYFSYNQLQMKVMGLKIGDLAYVTDIKDYDESIFQHLKGVKTLVVSALRHTHSHMHLTLDEAVQFGEKVQAEKIYITHISHELDHLKTNTLLPSHVRLAYDGLEISFNGL